jgi:hypothetical protein
MKTVRMICSLFRNVVEHDGNRRRERVERRPIVELMEPRALLSAFEPAGATVAPSHHSGGELVIPINEAPAVHVIYQANRAGASIAFARPLPAETASSGQDGSAGTMDVTTADDTTDDSDDDGDDGDDGDGDDGDDNGDNGDEIDDENDPDPGP